jgi:acetoin utilization deacetylase AcuC-like enzyme
MTPGGVMKGMTTTALPLFFTPAMVADSASFSPSAAKPLEVVASWRKLGVALDVRKPTRATVEEFSRAHDPRFVREVLELRTDNGFGNRSAEVARSLPWTTGSMRSAAMHAWKHGGAAIAPCSGFHHAGYANVSGYCTFNGLMVTAASLRAAGAKRIGIVDCDHHSGDGTDDIIRRIRAQDWVDHFTAGARYSRPRDVSAFFDELPRVLESMKGCDVVLYQAGADPHLDDPFGGWLSTEDLRQRDELVFNTLRAQGTPVAWNLAGGYQKEKDGSIPKVLEIHDNTLRACAAAFS